ncbi:MAG TPA: HAD hydrolase-like protein [Pyrinomonadaceae bacterium]|nr:HAD hydrolase-like protein [Pyrinomonadaceae bacterium]
MPASKLAAVKNVLFDLDGTLSDPVEGITRCICYALERMSVEPPGRADLLPHIGPPLRDTFSLILRTTDKPTIERAVHLYRERFSKTGMFENVVYDGVPEMLAQIRASRKRLFLATSKMRAFTLRILEHFALFEYFDGVYGSEPDGTLGEKADLIRHILASEGLRPRETVMVGDRKYDIMGAGANGCLAAGVTYGYGSAAELTEAEADFLCHSPLEVAELLSR